MTTNQSSPSVEEMAQRIVRLFNPERVILFGSCATGQATYDSDVDILVVVEADGSPRQKAIEIDRALSDRTLPLDLIVITPEQFERQKSLAHSIVCQALETGKVLYERAARSSRGIPAVEFRRNQGPMGRGGRDTAGVEHSQFARLKA